MKFMNTLKNTDYMKNKFFELSKKLGLKSEEHCISTAKYMLFLAEKFGYKNKEICFITGLFHDIAKDYDKNKALKLIKTKKIKIDNLAMKIPSIWHSYIGAYFIKNILHKKNKKLILDAIKYHPTGKPNMSLLLKFLFIADFCENKRKFKQSQILRKKVLLAQKIKDLDKIILEIAKIKINYCLEKNKIIHLNTIKLYNKNNE